VNAPVPPRLIRRAVIDPLWPVIVLACTAVFGAVLLLALLVAPLSSRRRVLRLSALAICYLWIDLALVAGCWTLWLRQPTPRRDEDRWRRRHAALLGWALRLLLTLARLFLGYEVHPVEEVVAPGDAPLIVLARHAGPGDSFTLVQLLVAAYRRRPKVVLKKALQWDPGLDLVLTRLACYFLPSPTGAGDDRTAAVAELARGLTADEALLIFPEGGNWTPRRHRRAVIRLMRAGHYYRARRARELSHVLPPRPGGALACLAACPDADVLVIAHCGLDTLVSPSDIWRALPLGGRPMRIAPWLYPAAEVPRAEDSALRWLEEQWTKVDEWVDGARVDISA